MSNILPEVGMFATVRNRHGVISHVEPYNRTESGETSHLVTVEYADSDGEPEDTLVWEREVGATPLQPNAFPDIENSRPMKAEEYLALLRATRWNAASPYLDPRNPEAKSDPSLYSPLYSAVKIDDFQLLPVTRAMEMPRVSLLIADDVGLGKTIEAGLILSELIRKRRIRRVLVLTPAALRCQWRDELLQKFSLDFDIVDRQSTHKMRQDHGMDFNPWRSLSRAITSYHYLRQPNVLEQFLSFCRAHSEDKKSPYLPWDLLIVDEAHNLMPANFGEDSDASRMLGQISSWFEHKVFLTATPHNGYTRCFSGLLEQLDPVQFTRRSEFSDHEKERIRHTVIRRLKSDINKQDIERNRPQHFAERFLYPLKLNFSTKEKALADSVERFCRSLKEHTGKDAELPHANFAIEVLRKRLLSCPTAFADSWLRCKEGMNSEKESGREVAAARKSVEEDIDDDLEYESRLDNASRVVGAWLAPFIEPLGAGIDGIDKALKQIGLAKLPTIEIDPSDDARFDALRQLIEGELRSDSKWGSDNRLVVFTEYKTTLDYLLRRLRSAFGDEDSIISLYGGMEEQDREHIKGEFNDPSSPAKILVATDAASEGLNLQETAHMLLHYDIPWNPSRLEQRNGRLDRHGQARNVEIYHFSSNDDASVAFVARVLAKVNEIRDDLGSMGEIFDKAFQSAMLDLEDEDRTVKFLELDTSVKSSQSSLLAGQLDDDAVDYTKRVGELAAELDISPQSLRDTLGVALGLGAASDAMEGPDERGRMSIKPASLPQWKDVIDTSLRLSNSENAKGSLPKVVFDAEFFIKDQNGRPVFRSSRDTALLHLGHPLFRHTLATFSRLRYPGGSHSNPAARWYASRGDVPKGASAAIILTIEEIAVNDLRETFHHWLRSLVFPVNGDELGEPVYWPASNTGAEDRSDQSRENAQKLWTEFGDECREFVHQHKSALGETLANCLARDRSEALEHESKAFESRIEEIRDLNKTNSIKKIERDLALYKAEKKQSYFFADDTKFVDAKIVDAHEELERRTRGYNSLMELLKNEKARVLKRIIPKRFALRGEAQAFPVSVEIRLPE